jgi:small GTP-binding protein
MILLLNKSDLQSEKQIDDTEMKDFLEKNNYLDNLEISIKNGTNIPELLNKINDAINDPKKELAANIVAETVEKNVGLMNAEGSLSLILVGDSTVGKTCLLNRYFKNQFKSTISNIGIDKDIKFVKINNNIYKLTVWDTVGQERFRALPKKYYQNADGVLLLFDVTKEESFSNVSTWMKDIKDNSNKESNIIIYLIGNKIDLNERAVSKESAEELAQSLGMKYFDVSCKNNINISEIMSRMILECHMKVNKITNCFKIDVNKKGDNKGRRCCL